jgi:HTH-type transcriptional regulator, pleiotropic regulator of extracellular virulence genes
VARPFLRDIVADLDQWEQEVDQLRSELNQVSRPQDELSILGRLGDRLRLSADTRAESLSMLYRAVQLATELDADTSRIANQIRLATALQYAGRHLEAIRLFEETLSLIRQTDQTPLLDYALQHFGKCLAEVNEVERAAGCFRQALKIRRDLGDRGLLDSTLEALAAIE